MNNSSASFTRYLWIPHGLTYQSRLRCNNHPLTWYSVLIHKVLSPASFRVFPSALTTLHPQLKRDLSLLPHCEMVSNRMCSVINTRKNREREPATHTRHKKITIFIPSTYPPESLVPSSLYSEEGNSYGVRTTVTVFWDLAKFTWLHSYRR